MIEKELKKDLKYFFSLNTNIYKNKIIGLKSKLGKIVNKNNYEEKKWNSLTKGQQNTINLTYKREIKKLLKEIDEYKKTIEEIIENRYLKDNTELNERILKNFAILDLNKKITIYLKGKKTEINIEKLIEQKELYSKNYNKMLNFIEEVKIKSNELLLALTENNTSKIINKINQIVNLNAQF
jgi:hypothetical protein